MAFVISFGDEEKNERATKRMSKQSNDRQKSAAQARMAWTRGQEKDRASEWEREKDRSNDRKRGTGRNPAVWSYAPFGEKKNSENSKSVFH